MTVDVANITRLNLGRFNSCVDYLGEGQTAEYGIPDRTPDSVKLNGDLRVLYYPSRCGLIVRLDDEHVGSSIEIPLFDIGCATDKGKIDDSEVIDRLMAHIDLEVMSMVHRIVKEGDANRSMSQDDIKISVRGVKFFDNDKSDGCYGFVEVGVAFIA